MSADNEIKVSIVTDQSDVDTTQTVRALDDVDQAATELDRTMRRVDFDPVTDGARHAGRELEDLPDSMRDTSRAADDMADSVRKSSDDMADSVRKSSREMKGGLDDFKGEAHQSGREAAASFSGGFDDVVDFVQETAANAFGGFGAVGQAAGIAAAVGLGAIVSVISAAKERVDELRRSFTDVAIAGDGMAESVRVVLDDLRDNDELTNLANSARTLHIDWVTLVRAMAGSEADLRKVQDGLDEVSSSGYMTRQVGDQLGAAFDNVSSAVGRSGSALSGAAAEARAYGEAQAAVTAADREAAEQADRTAQAHQRAQDTITGALSGLAATQAGYTSVVQAAAQTRANATKTEKDTWADYADAVKLSAADVVKVLNEQTQAAENFRANLLEVQQRGDEEFLAWVSQQPAQVAAAYAAGTAAQQSAIYEAFRRNVGAQASLGVAQGMADTASAPTAQAARIHDAIADQLGRPLAPMKPTVDGAAARAGAQQIRLTVDRLLGGPITIPVSIDASAARAQAARIRAELQDRMRP